MLIKTPFKHLIFTTLLALPGLATAMMGGSCTPSLSWNSSYPLAFGNFAAGSGGTVVVSSTSDTVSTTGGVHSFGGTISRARFNLTCSNNSMETSTTYSISTNTSVTLSSGVNSMTLNTFTPNPASGTINPGSSATVYVGGTLNANANQASGNYSGSFSVTVNYP